MIDAEELNSVVLAIIKHIEKQLKESGNKYINAKNIRLALRDLSDSSVREYYDSSGENSDKIMELIRESLEGDYSKVPHNKEFMTKITEMVIKIAKLLCEQNCL